jgi:prophage regulatory protein
MNAATLPQTGFLKIHYIIGDAKKGIIGIYPVSRASWYQGIKSGKYPQPVHLGGGRSSAWRVEDIRDLLKAQA